MEPGLQFDGEITKSEGMVEVLMKILHFSDIPLWPHLMKSCVVVSKVALMMMTLQRVLQHMCPV